MERVLFMEEGKKHIFFSFKNNYFKNLMFHIFKNIQRRILLLLFLGELIEGFFVQEVVVGGVISFYKYFYQ